MRMTAAPAFVLGLALTGACSGAVPVTSTPEGPPATATTTPQEREVVVGRLAIVYGDPPPDSGLPAQMRYILTERDGRRWTLTFDERVYAPPQGGAAFKDKEVEVQGRRTGSDRLLVESIRVR